MTIKQSRHAIAATGLWKSFGGQVVLDGLDPNVPRGTAFSLLGARTYTGDWHEALNRDIHKKLGEGGSR